MNCYGRAAWIDTLQRSGRGCDLNAQEPFSQKSGNRPRSYNPKEAMAHNTYNPGDLPPERYLAWHEWADVQRRAGIKQVRCGKCGLWKTPQELSSKAIKLTRPVCSKCEALE